jgi:aminoglycoside 6'-N-acetyltransferase I
LIVKIIDVTDHGEIVQQIAKLLVDSFSGTGSESWGTVEEATNEVRQSLAADRISRATVDETVGVIGWISGIEEYDGHVWELHPLVVHKDHRRKASDALWWRISSNR